MDGGKGARGAGLLLTAALMCSAALSAFAGVNAAFPTAGSVRAASAGAVQAEDAGSAAGAEPADDAAPASGPLAGQIVLVDAGHGGYDGGAYGRVSGTAEKELNLDVAERLARMLREQGAKTVMTRTGDYALCDDDPPGRKKLQDMQRREALAKEAGVTLVLSIHMNEYAGRSESGPQVFYREGCPAGRLLAGALQAALISGLQPKKEREALGGDFYLLELGVPSALVECGFLSNAEEEALLLTAAYRERVAAAITRGVLDWAALPAPKPAPLPAAAR